MSDKKFTVTLGKPTNVDYYRQTGAPVINLGFDLNYSNIGLSFRLPIYENLIVWPEIKVNGGVGPFTFTYLKDFGFQREGYGLGIDLHAAATSIYVEQDKINNLYTGSYNYSLGGGVFEYQKDLNKNIGEYTVNLPGLKLTSEDLIKYDWRGPVGEGLAGGAGAAQ